MNHETLVQILSILRPGAEWTLSGDDYSGLTWLDAVRPKPSLDEINAVDVSPSAQAARLNLQARAAAITQLEDVSASPKLIRAVMLTLLDEINSSRGWIQAFVAATAAATSLADLKTRVAALPAMPDRTVAQAKQAIQSKINAGTSD